MPRHLVRRSGIWHYYRRVPAKFADVDTRTFVKVSLETRDLNRAEKLKAKVDQEVEAYWCALKSGASDNAHERYERAIERARLEGFAYRPASEFTEDDVGELIERVKALQAIVGDGPKPPTANEQQAVAALLGGEEVPAVLISEALEKFYALTRDKVRRKSPDQLRRWKAPRMKAMTNFLALVGDKEMRGITRSDALIFRSWWVDRVVDEDYTPNSANKDIGHLAQVIDTLDESLRLGLDKPFGGLRLSDDQQRKRPAFPVRHLQEMVLDREKLAGMNDEALAILHIMVETGMRPIEICALEPMDIHLDDEVPHVVIAPKANWEMKTKYSRREIPVIGISLEALKRFPNGFERYRDKSSQLSAAVNSYLSENKLLPTEDHTLYSIRHTFKDRLVAADIQDRLQDELMGHKSPRPVYGEGPTLGHKQEWLLRIAIT